MPTEPLDPSPRPAARPQQARGAWAMRDRPALAWLVLAVVVVLIHPFVPAGRWLMVHLVVLGALTHSIVVWSTHFATALLKTPPTLDERHTQNQRLVLLLVGVVLVLVGVPAGAWHMVVAGAVVVSAAVLWHAVQLWRRLRGAIGSRYRLTVHYSIAAALCLPVGATFGALLAREPADPWYGRLLLAHTLTMLLGWVGLAVVGTLTTLWPTVLRARMDLRAQTLAQQAFPGLLAALAAVVGSALVGRRDVLAVSLLLYLAGLLWWARGLRAPWRAANIRELAPLSVLAAMCWAVVGIVVVTVKVATAPDIRSISESYGVVTTIFVAGFALQLLVGALSHLVPAVLGGGPSVVRAGGEWFDKGASLRLVVVNLGLAFCLLPVASVARVLVSIAVFLALASFVPLMLRAVKASVAARRAAAERGVGGAGEPLSIGGIPAPGRADAVAPARPERPQRLSSVQATAGAAIVAVLASLGVAVAAGPSSLGSGTAGTASTASQGVAATGEATRVRVVAAGMRFEPSTIEVPAGNRLEIELVNEDPEQSHDLQLSTGPRTQRLAPGATEVLDAGVVGGPLDGWCSVIGHRQMGMTLAITTTGAGATASGSGHAGHTTTPGTAATQAPGTTSLAARGIDLMKTPDESFTAVDPVLPPLGTERVHRLTLKTQELELEVAPGVWQKRWTFNGRAPGPTLHGRVGDRFEITLVNDGSMGHSIDFHAGALAPDRPMRTIAPGESLTYTFTATRSGIWMYHCSTMPMSAHIAAGMHGAVVIEPEGLPAVDRSYVLVQSEAYLGASTEQGSADEVDMDAIAAERPTLTVFNGIASQYDHRPLPAKVGERVRIWVLDAGPNRSLAFHVVGGQFDTVWTEGTYRVNRGRAASGTDTSTGAQVLPLLAAQAGFVELVLPEAGHYPFVNHQMVDAERGAHGILEVTD